MTQVIYFQYIILFYQNTSYSNSILKSIDIIQRYKIIMNEEEKPNTLNRIIDKGDKQLASDSWSKRLFTLRQVLARIAIACIPELSGLPQDVVAQECLGGPTECGPEYVRSIGGELILPNDCLVTSDLVFGIWMPSQKSKQPSQLLNLEIQNDSRNLDRIIGRGMLYSSGILCSEYGIFYSYPKYEKCKTVNTVWICPAAPSARSGTVLRFRMQPEGMTAENAIKWLPKNSYDKLRMVIVNINGDTGWSKKDLTGFVWTLMTTRLKALQRKKILKEVYGMTMTKTIEKAIEDDDKWRIMLYGPKHYAAEMRAAKANGKKQGLEEGRQQGLAEGRQQGLVEGEQLGILKQKESITLNMLSMHLSIPVIEQATQLSQDDILSIAKKHNVTI